MEKPEILLIGKLDTMQDVAATVTAALKRNNHTDIAEDFSKEVEGLRCYNDVLWTVAKYVNIRQ